MTEPDIPMPVLQILLEVPPTLLARADEWMNGDGASPPAAGRRSGPMVAGGARATARQAADHWFSRLNHGFDCEPIGRRLRSAATRTRLDRGAYCRDRVSLGRG